MSNRKLIEMISALLALDEQRALVPHGVGGHGRELLERSANALAEHDALAAQRDEGLAREAELRSSCADLSSHVRELEHKMDYWEGCNKALQQRLAEAEKDAARYRWLRDRPLDGSEPFWIAVSSDDVYQTRCWALGGSSPDTCDRAIDKAMSSAGLVGQEQPS